MTSAYPRTIDDIVPAARKLAAELGQVPSRNKLKKHFRIGADKANAVLTILNGTETDPVTIGETTETAATAGVGLHLVPLPPADPVDSDQADDVQHEDAPAEPTPVAAKPTPPTPAAVADPALVVDDDAEQVDTAADPGTTTVRPTDRPVGRRWRWVLLPMAVSAFVAIWSGWVGLGEMTGFGIVHPLPGIADGFQLNTAITLPLGVEAYAAYALRVWLARIGTHRAQRFAKWSALGSLVLGSAGQVAFHLMSAMGIRTAPWPITTCVACLPVIVLGLGAALAHLQHDTAETIRQ